MNRMDLNKFLDRRLLIAAFAAVAIGGSVYSYRDELAEKYEVYYYGAAYKRQSISATEFRDLVNQGKISQIRAQESQASGYVLDNDKKRVATYTTEFPSNTDIMRLFENNKVDISAETRTTLNTFISDYLFNAFLLCSAAAFFWREVSKRMAARGNPSQSPA